MIEDIKTRLVSRKLWAALLGAILPHVSALLTGSATTEEAVTASSAILCAYILGQAGVDAMAAKAKGD